MLEKQISNKIIFYLTCLVLVGIVIILALNFTEIFSSPKNEKYIAYNNVRGMAIEHRKLLYTLNFDQQNQVIDYINMSLPVGRVALTQSKEPLNFTKIIIYRFNKPDLIMTPVEVGNQNIVFFIPEWNPDGYIKDVTLGKLNNLIASTYDP